MAVRLCAQGVGEEPSPYRLLRKLSAADITLYQAFYNKHRFGDEPTYFLLAQLTALLYNQRRREAQDPSRPTDWLPWYVPPEQDPDDMFRQLRSVTRDSRNH